MAYNLPPISTLSAVLGQDDHQQQQHQLQIAPELLDDPANHSHGQQESSERHGAHQQWTTDSHYQVDESTDDLRWIDTQQPAEPLDQPPPRKKARSRASVNTIDLANIINEATVAEYEDPAGDWRSGVVYVHAPTTPNQACVRCHRIKRKCDNARPRCAGCWKADTPCVFEISPATAELVVNLKNEQNRTTSDLQVAQQRVAELEAQLVHSSAPVHSHHEHTTQIGSFPHPPAEVERYYTGFAQTILGMNHVAELEPAQSSNHPPLPSLEVLQMSAGQFFDAYSLQYPFMDRGGIMVDLLDIATAEQGSGTSSVGQRREFVVLMLTSVGAFLRESKGEMETVIAQELRERAMRILGTATSKTDLITVQAYLALLSSVLLGLHPEVSAHNVLALAMQAAITLNLHRKSASPTAEGDLRSKIWWTIYNLDRSLSIGLIRPLSIADCEIDATLPASDPDVDSQASIFNAIIAHRRIISNNYTKLYSRTNSSIDIYSTGSENEIGNWRKSWSGSRSDNIGQTYSQLLWLQALCLLHRPASFETKIDPVDLETLGGYAQEAFEIYQESAASPRDLINLAWRYQIVITLLYTTSQSSDMNHDQITAQIEACRQVVASGSNFEELEKMRMVFQRLSEALLGGTGSTVAEAGNRILAGLYGPLDSGSEEVKVDSSGGLETKRDQNEVLSWDHLI